MHLVRISFSVTPSLSGRFFSRVIYSDPAYCAVEKCVICSSENVTLQAAYSIEISVPPRYGEHRYILSERSQNVVMCDPLGTTESIEEVAFTIRGKTSTVGRRTKSA